MSKKLYFMLWQLSASLFVISCQEYVEYGLHDGSDYCFYKPGSCNSSVYPTVEQKNNIKDVYYDHQSDICSGYRTIEKVNFDQVRSQFPVLQQIVNGHPLVYLDSSSSAQMPQSVLDSIVAYYQTFKSNIGRGIYDFAGRATELFEQTRDKVAFFLGAKKQEIIFTPGTTAGLNLVAQMWAEHAIGKGDEIIVSELEHNANFIPWQQLAQRKDAVLKVLPINQQGVITPQALQDAISEKTKLVALFHQSNAMGSINDIAGLTEVAHSVGAKIVVDAAQSIVIEQIDVVDLDCDFLAFSAHKLFGPTGIGALFVKEEILKECKIQNFGGGMAIAVHKDHTEFKSYPHCFEAGTQAIAQVIGLGAAIDFVQQHLNFAQVQKHETELVLHLTNQLTKLDGIDIISHIPEQGQHNNIVTFIPRDHHAYDVAVHMNEYGIAVRAGYHCAHVFHEKLGGRASVRVSFSVYNTKDDVDKFVACLKKLLQQ